MLQLLLKTLGMPRRCCAPIFLRRHLALQLADEVLCDSELLVSRTLLRLQRERVLRVPRRLEKLAYVCVC